MSPVGSGTGVDNAVKAGHIASKSCRRLVALMPSCGVATSDVQTDQGKAVTKKDPGPETGCCDAQDATMLVGGGGSEIAVGAKFDSFVTFRQ